MTALDTFKKYKNRNKQFILDYLQFHPCIDCGEADPIVLEFDHVEGHKIANISKMIKDGWKLEKIEAELLKCVVRCANCHRRKTAKDRSYFRL